MKVSKIIIIGGNRFNEDYPLEPILETAIKKGIKIVVITDHERVRYPTNSRPSFYEYLKERQIKLVVVENLKLSDIKPHDEVNTIVLSLNCRWIISEDIIDYFKDRIYNYHNAKLPYQKGAACHSWRLMQQESKTGLSIHRVEPKLDCGQVIHSIDISYGYEENLKQTYSVIRGYEDNFFKQFLEGEIKAIKTNNDVSEDYYWPRLNTSIHGYINWNWTANEIEAFCKSFSDPFEGAKSFIKSKKVFLKSASMAHDKANFHPFQYGLIYRLKDNNFYVACRGGGIVITEIEFESHPIRIREGLRIHTPAYILDAALQGVNYDSN